MLVDGCLVQALVVGLSHTFCNIFDLVKNQKQALAGNE